MKKKLLLTALGLGTTLACMGLVACKRNLDVQESFPFKVSLLPIPKKIAKGEVVEMRFSIKAEQHSDLNSYRLRYFQYDGKGTLHPFSVAADPMKANDHYTMPEGDFKLFYKSNCNEQQMLELVFEDNKQQTQTIEINFNNKSKKNETQKN